MSIIFLQIEVISAYFNLFGKLAASVLSLKIWNRYWENISLFSFNILTGISSCGATFSVLKFLICYKVKKKIQSDFWNIVLSLKCLNVFYIFFIACNNGSFSSLVSQKILSSSSMFNVVTMLPKTSWNFQLFLHHLSKLGHLQQVLFRCS